MPYLENSKAGLIRSFAVSLLLVAASFVLIIGALWFFASMVAHEVLGFVSSIPASSVLTYGGVTAAILYILKKYK